jgi:undecaprenyl-diphosphatase
MPEWLLVVIAGIVEGITEFLPISSTGHLILTTSLLNFDGYANIFEIFIQSGAILAVIFFYWQQLSSQFKTISSPRTQQHWMGVVLAFVPAGLVGFFIADYLDTFFQPYVVGIGLIVGGIMFLLVEHYVKVPQTSETPLIEAPLSLRQAFLIGCWQVLALFPGMSRSGMSILGALSLGIDRRRATEFSFYLAIPTLGIASVYSLIKNLYMLSANDLAYLFLGALVSGIVAWFAIAWLLRYVSSHNFVPFAWYRIVLGVVILLVIFRFQPQ